jgi:carbon storage regulator
MLVLTRKTGQRIIMEDPISGTITKVLVVSQKGDAVRLGIEAPAHVRILREELVTKPEEVTA